MGMTYHNFDYWFMIERYSCQDLCIKFKHAWHFSFSTLPTNHNIITPNIVLIYWHSSFLTL